MRIGAWSNFGAVGLVMVAVSEQERRALIKFADEGRSGRRARTAVPHADAIMYAASCLDQEQRLWVAVHLCNDIARSVLVTELARAEIWAGDDPAQRSVVDSAKQNCSGRFKKRPLHAEVLRLKKEADEARAKEQQGRLEADAKRRLAPVTAWIAGLNEALKKTHTRINEPSAADIELAELWSDSIHNYKDTNPNNPFSNKNTMISARCAEVAIRQLCQRWGKSVEDIAIRQIRGGHGWEQCDLSVDGVKVDVKNLRSGRGQFRDAERMVYAESRVKTWKPGVRISGAVSPLINFNASVSGARDGEVLWLGEVDYPEVEAIKRFSSERLEVQVVSRPSQLDSFVPAWMYEFPKWVYDAVTESLPIEMDALTDTRHGFGLLGLNQVAVSTALGVPVSETALASLGIQEMRSLVVRLCALAGSNQLTRPLLFLEILCDYLAKSVRQEEFRPEGYRGVVAFKQGSEALPLGLLDPGRAIHGLISTLGAMHRARTEESEQRLAECTQFRITAEGVLMARSSDNDGWTTLIAYCHRCKKQPLVFGLNETCESCGGLRCAYRNKKKRVVCGSCKPACEQGPARFRR